ncbi:hypothetical protein [Aliikangiella maris]|uniref:Uncharacterized protein n=2 Tax=Aliikangiella maris TaxID=3162458 RepID=A0ABV2BYD7_9GAMM
MKKHLNLTEEELTWLTLLSETTTNKKLINFIVNLDDIYKGADSYLSTFELPGFCLTEALIDSKRSHPKFQSRAFLSALKDMPFFKVGLRLVGVNGERWNPTTESIKAFSIRHATKEVIYYENQSSDETISYFKNKLSQLSKMDK